jgi:hypothetical protein
MMDLSSCVRVWCIDPSSEGQTILVEELMDSVDEQVAMEVVVVEGLMGVMVASKMKVGMTVLEPIIGWKNPHGRSRGWATR